MTKWIESELEERLGTTRTGFCRHFSTLRIIFVIEQFVRRVQGYNFHLIMTFIGFQKAFDSVKRSVVINNSHETGVECGLAEYSKFRVSQLFINIFIFKNKLDQGKRN